MSLMLLEKTKALLKKLNNRLFKHEKMLNTYSGNSHEDYLKHAENQILEFTRNMKKNKSKSKIESKKWIS